MRLKKPIILTTTLLFTQITFTSFSEESSYAETQYVSDKLIITLREGKGEGFKAIRRLKTDTPVEVLQQDGRYLKVRTKEGEEGWVAKQYISPNKPKVEIIIELRKEINQLKLQIEELKKARASLWDDLKAAKQDYEVKVKKFEENLEEIKQDSEQTTKMLEQITNEYNTLLYKSKHLSELTREYESLKTENEKLNAEKQKLQHANNSLSPPSMFWWFIAGAGVFCFGLISGIVVKKKKYYIDI